jgi:hypothetical protein
MSEQKKSFIYNNSLSIAFLLLAFISLSGQAFTGLKQYNEFLFEHNHHPVTLFKYFSTGHFIQATFENWESEFLSVFAIIFLSIYLRESGSPQSKPVDATHAETGE